jgi:carbonic anhydrase/acetyltransferase-like protein (isoleucine patch superfamily)
VRRGKVAPPSEEGAAMAIFELDGEAPDLPPGGRYWIADSAVVIGRVRLKTDASVWFNAVLRGDNEWIELGERSQIQDNAVLHTDPGFPLKIGENCVIGHNVVLHGCTIASNSLIGMGAVVLNGARIGKNCLVGAGAVVTEGKEFPDNSLIVGAPARALRTLDENAAQAITHGADIYVRRWQQYAKSLKRIG